MRRNFLRSFLICLVPTLLAAFYVGLGFYNQSIGKAGFRQGIDLAGGTILIYEVDPDQRKAGWNNEDIKQLADKLKKRIDPNDLQNVVVRPLGTDRVEIILPFAGSNTGAGKANNEEFIDGVRQKVKQTGVLEFRIAANTEDDKEAIADARKMIDQADDVMKQELKLAAERGKAPPAPTNKTYMVKAAGDYEIPVTYEWVELGKEERETMGLSSKYDDKPKIGGNGPLMTNMSMAASRGMTYIERSKGERGPSSVLLYSREFSKKEKLTEEANKKVEYFVLTRSNPEDKITVTGDVQISARPEKDNKNDPSIGFRFERGGTQFENLTRRNRAVSMHRHMAVLMDSRVVSMPHLNDPLPGGGQITGNMTQAQVNSQVAILQSGSLSAALKPDPVSENTIGSTLGEQTKTNGLIAVAASFLVVMLFMLVYYRFAGFVACVALLVNLVMTIGFMVAMNAAFTLPGLAGLVLMLGMAVDANVLIYERLREEREKGATLATAIRNGYDRALPTIIDTHLTSIGTAIVLYMFGNDALKGFSVSLTVGLIISLFTSLFITRLMFDFWVSKKWLTDLKMMKLFAKPNFDFMKIRKPMFWLTGILTVLGLGLFLFRGEKVLNVDFTQGTAYGGRLVDGQAKSMGELSKMLGEDEQKTRLDVDKVIRNSTIANANIYEVVYKNGDRQSISLVTPPEGATDAEKEKNLVERLSKLPDVSVEQVFLANDKDLGFGKSLSFTVRTTEKEKEIVQLNLDRLLRDDSKNPLLSTAKVRGFEVTSALVPVTFDKPVSPSYFRDFVNRALKVQGNEATEEGQSVIVTGVTNADTAIATEENKNQKFTTLLLDFSKNSNFELFSKPGADTTASKKAITEAITSAKTTFESRPLPDRLETFDPALAKDARNSALMAILLSWAAILAYLWFRFGSWQFGLAAVICLIHDLCFTLGAIAVCHYVAGTTFGHLLGLHDFKIDLTAIAALLTLVGYSVNDTIVVFDRIREVRGKSPALTPAMINESVNGTLSRTVLAALTVFLVVVVLYLFGGDGIHLFAFVMVMGVIVGTYSSIYIASPLLLIFGEGKARTPNVTIGGSTGGGGTQGGEPAELGTGIDPLTGQPQVKLAPVSAIPS
jgi:SecD/SecF fusion protein